MTRCKFQSYLFCKILIHHAFNSYSPYSTQLADARLLSSMGAHSAHYISFPLSQSFLFDANLLHPILKPMFLPYRQEPSTCHKPCCRRWGRPACRSCCWARRRGLPPRSTPTNSPSRSPPALLDQVRIFSLTQHAIKGVIIVFWINSGLKDHYLKKVSKIRNFI